jgi:hypothetical protein
MNEEKFLKYFLSKNITTLRIHSPYFTSYKNSNENHYQVKMEKPTYSSKTPIICEEKIIEKYKLIYN